MKPNSRLRDGTVCALLFLACAMAARPARALWVQVPVTKSGGVYNNVQITVHARPMDRTRGLDVALEEFEVVLAAHPNAVSPFLSTRLGVIADGKWVALIPVSEEREKNTVTYVFRVAASALAQSYFEINASAYAPLAADAPPPPSVFATAVVNGRKVEQIMGGVIYLLNLRDFAHP